METKDTTGRSRMRLAIAAAIAVALLAGAGLAVGRLAQTAGPVTPVSTAAPPPATAVAGAYVQATVTRVVDGDTIHVLMPDGTDETVRFIGVNTPESTTRHEPYGAEASAYVKKRLPKGLTVWLEVDARLRDKYGRMLAYVWLERPTSTSLEEVRAKMFNAQLLIEGYAQLMTIPPDVRYVDVFTPLQAEARDANRGLWGLPAK